MARVRVRALLPDAVVRSVQRASVTGQLLGVIVDRIDRVARRDLGLGMEDQVFAKLPHLLKIRGDGRGSRHLRSFSCWYAFAAAWFSALVIAHIEATSAPRCKLSIPWGTEKRRATGGRGCGEVAGEPATSRAGASCGRGGL
jgi:hypothetical protein